LFHHFDISVKKVVLIIDSVNLIHSYYVSCSDVMHYIKTLKHRRQLIRLNNTLATYPGTWLLQSDELK